MKLVKSMVDHTQGAVYVSRNTIGDKACIWPAGLGISKREGCVEFIRASDQTNFRDAENVSGWSCLLSDNECDEIYFDHPGKEEAWLVLPHKNGKDYHWIQVDHKLELLEE